MLARLRLALVVALLIAGCLPSADPTEPADVTPVTTASPSAAAASASPSASPSPSPEATPTATADLGALELDVTGCNGGVVLEWSPSLHPDFHHYTALRSPDAEIATGYPPIAPAVDWGDTYATDRYVTSAVDASIIPTATRWSYRVMAYDAAGRVVGSSPVRGARLLEVERLGSLSAAPMADGATILRWGAFGGFSRCFSAYRILHGIGQATTVLTVVSDQSTAEVETDALHPGVTYALRVQAVRATTLGTFVVGETETISYTVPPEG